MAIFESIFGTYADRLQLGLDRASQRHGMLLGNMANVNTPGYKRKDLDFSVALDEAGDRVNARFHNRARFQPHLSQRMSNESSTRVDGSNVDMEREVASVAETELRYQSLIEMTNRYFSGLKSVIREGR